MPGSSSSALTLPGRDLDDVLEQTQDLWTDLRGAHLFVTGGTAFFGRWMLESFLKANDEFGLGASATLLTRNAGDFERVAPHIARHRAVEILVGDVRSFALPVRGCTHILHMATEAHPGMTGASSFMTAVEGTARVLDLAARRKTLKLLLTSSGAVYGRQPPDCALVSEDHRGAPHPEDVSAGYGHGKRAAEFMCAAAAATTDLEVKIARCFAFVGPALPLDQAYAIGNFIRDALSGEAVHVASDGTARRSYLYAGDLAAWLWTILLRGVSGRPYNVGSEADVSIGDVAALVARVVRPGTPVQIAMPPRAGELPARYVPSTARAATELGLRSTIELEEAVTRTVHWYQARTNA